MNGGVDDVHQARSPDPMSIDLTGSEAREEVFNHVCSLQQNPCLLTVLIYSLTFTDEQEGERDQKKRG